MSLFSQPSVCVDIKHQPMDRLNAEQRERERLLFNEQENYAREVSKELKFIRTAISLDLPKKTVSPSPRTSGNQPTTRPAKPTTTPLNKPPSKPSTQTPVLPPRPSPLERNPALINRPVAANKEKEFNLPADSDLEILGRLGAYQMAQPNRHASLSSATARPNLLLWVYTLSLILALLCFKKRFY
ncbi:hypothetical protein A0J61_02127 [Choanephora cucurbitarum]|uniref:Uncharacterized protein n=1 Tax=Choanephora cucurbitarum TaxID=101091 RepID=A0A1C7NL05_9FUNG|nr:hypothetical protein A0J61_02127 [Choanephora cucurbitarum]